MSKLEMLEAIIAARDERIENQKETVDRMHAEIARLKADLAQAELFAKGFKEQNLQARAELANSNRHGQELAAEVVRMTGELEDAKAELAEAETECVSLNKGLTGAIDREDKLREALRLFREHFNACGECSECLEHSMGKREAAALLDPPKEEPHAK